MPLSATRIKEKYSFKCSALRTAGRENSEPGAIPGRYRHCVHIGYRRDDESQSLGNREGSADIGSDKLRICESGDLLEGYASGSEADLLQKYGCGSIGCRSFLL